MGRRLGFGGVDDEDLVDLRCEVERFVAQAELADEGMSERLDSRPVQAHVMGGPPFSKLVTAYRQLSDEVGEVAVIRVSPGGRAKVSNGGVGDAVPVDVEVPGPVRAGRRSARG